MRMRSKMRRCLVLHAQLKTSSTHAHAQQSARFLVCAVKGLFNLLRMRTNASSAHAHAQQSVPLPRVPCAAECLINPMRMRSKCFTSHSHEQHLPQLRINHHYASLKLKRKCRYFRGALCLNNSHQNYLRIFDKFPSYYRPYTLLHRVD
jgi:hypothetical protein